MRMAIVLGVAAALLTGLPGCQLLQLGAPVPSPQELLYVWTGDGDQKDHDFLVIIDLDPISETYGEILNTVDVGSSGNEVHHMGFTADRSKIFAGSLFSSRIFHFDLAQNPGHPPVEVIENVPELVGYSAPHSFHPLPDGKMLVTFLGSATGGLPGGLAVFSREGELLEVFPPPDHTGPPTYMYDVGLKPQINRMITSSFTPPDAYRPGIPPLDRVGDEVVVWDLETREVLQVAQLDKAPLEVRWLHDPRSTVGFVNAAFGDSVWAWRRAEDGTFAFRRVIELPQGSIPVDMRISPDDRFLYVSLFGADEVRQYDISDPFQPELASTVRPGPTPNMIRLGADGERLFVTNSLLSSWDRAEQFYLRLIRITPTGMVLDEDFSVDFNAFPTGPARPHDMLLRAR